MGPYTSNTFLPGPTPVEPLYGSGQICSHDHTFVAMPMSSIFTVSGASNKDTDSEIHLRSGLLRNPGGGGRRGREGGTE